MKPRDEFSAAVVIACAMGVLACVLIQKLLGG